MIDRPTSLTPAEMLLERQKQKREEKRVLPTKIENTQVLENQRAILGRIVARIVEFQAPKVPTFREVTRTVEGFSGYAPRDELFRAAKDTLRGQTYKPIRVDEETTTHREDSDSKPLENVHVSILIDGSFLIYSKEERLRQFQEMLLAITNITPVEINQYQTETKIKRVTFTVTVLMPTPDGHTFIPLRAKEPEALLQEYTQTMERGLEAVDKSPVPALTSAARALDILDASERQVRQESGMASTVFSRAIIVSGVSDQTPPTSQITAEKSYDIYRLDLKKHNE